MMFTPGPPPMPNPAFIEAEGKGKQQNMRRDFAIRMPSADKIIGILMMLAFIIMLILMNVFHLF